MWVKCNVIRRSQCNNLKLEMVVFALTLIRHGETCANKDDVIQGQLDVPLSEIGLQQAHLLGTRLQNQKYTHVYASDLTRAKQTAQTILDKSQYSTCRIFEEPKLRERKFGEVEGKTFNELKKLARRANQSVPNFTPSGAETVQQVRHRAVLFFQDLCQLLLKTSDSSSASSSEHSKETECQSHAQESHSSTVVTGIKRRRHSSISFDSEKCNNVAQCIRQTSSATSTKVNKVKTENNSSVASNVQKINCNEDVESVQKSVNTKSWQTLPSHTMSNSTEVSSPLCVYVPSWRYSRKAVGKETSSHGMPIAKGTVLLPHHSMPFSNIINGECPNVSLCPSPEGKIAQVPSIECDRKTSIDSSNDDLDAFPCLSANVLVVSHGGLLRELVRHFVEDLGCTVPGGKAQALRISPNTGLSKFTVSVVDCNEKPRVICLLIHDKDHLVENGMNSIHSSVL